MPYASLATGDEHFREKTFAEAAAAYRNALKRGPPDPMLLEALGTALARQGQLSRALVRLRAAVFDGGHPSPTARAKYALIACEYGLRDHALQQLDAWLRDTPRSVPLLLTRARVRVQTRDPASRLDLLHDSLADVHAAAALPHASPADKRSVAHVRAMLLTLMGKYGDARSALPPDGTLDAEALRSVIDLLENRGAADATIVPWHGPSATSEKISAICRLLRLLDAHEVAKEALDTWSTSTCGDPLVLMEFAQLAQWLALRDESGARNELLARALGDVERAYGLTPHWGDVRAMAVWMRGVIRALTQDPKNALKDFGELVANRKHDPDPAFNIALANDPTTRRGAGSADKFEAYLQEFGDDDVYAVCELAVARAMSGDRQGNEAALKGLGDALALVPENAEAHVNRGIVLRRLRKFKEANDDFIEAARLKAEQSTSDIDLAFDRALLLEARYRAKDGTNPPRFEDAVAGYEDVLRLAEEAHRPHSGASINLGLLRMSRPATLEDAIRCFDHVSQTDLQHDLAVTFKTLALADLERNDPAKAAEYRKLAREALECGTEPGEAGPWALARAVALVRVHRYDDAIRVLDLYSADSTQQPLVMFYRASAYRAVGRTHEAAEQLDLFFTLSGTKDLDAEIVAVAHIQRALLYHEAEDYVSALAALDKALALREVAAGVRAEAHVVAARTLICQERYAEARERGDEATLLDPKSYEVWETFGYATIRYGETLGDMEIVADGIDRLEEARKLLLAQTRDDERDAKEARIVFMIGYAYGVRQEFWKAETSMSAAEQLAAKLEREKRPFSLLAVKDNLRRLKRGRATPFDVPPWVKYSMTVLCVLLLGMLYVHVDGKIPISITQPGGAPLATITVTVLLLIPVLYLLPALSKIKFGQIELQRVESVPIKWTTMPPNVQKTLNAVRADGEAWQNSDRRMFDDVSTEAARAKSTDVWRPLTARFRTPVMPTQWNELAIGVFHGREIFATPHDDAVE